MRVLVTGGTGYIGGAVLQALRAAGHEPRGVVRSEEAARGVRARGGVPVNGDLRAPRGLAELARDADAVIHAANTQSPDAAEADIAASRAIRDALEGSGKPFVLTSGAWVLGDTGDRMADETWPCNPVELVAWRGPLEEEILATPGMRGIVLRPGVVFGEHGGIPESVAQGELPVVGDGAQHWALVHVRDLAELYVRALGAPAGAILHGIALVATMRDVALLGAARRGGRSFESATLAQARDRLGAFADALAINQRISSDRTQALLGWRPSRTSLVEEFLGDGRLAAA